MNDDILLMVEHRILIFNAQWEPLDFEIELDASKLLLTKDLKLLRISSNSMASAG
jgi:hypothetical protein